MVVDPLTGGEDEAPQIHDEARKLGQRRGWDYTISVTDLPVIRGGRVVVAIVHSEPGVGALSLPALGATLLRRRVREAVLQLASELRLGTSESDRNRQRRPREAQEGRSARSSKESAKESAGEESLRGRGARQLIGRRFPERLAPIKRVKPTGGNSNESDADVRYVAPGVRGRIKLLSGMVLANNPFALFATMKGTLVAAFATGAYALIFRSVRVLSDSFGPARLITFMVISTVAVGLWLVVAYGLWERPSEHKSRRLSRLYNTVTVLTLGVSVSSLYAVLLMLAFLAALFLVPAELFGSTIGRSPGLGDYLNLALVTASLATIAGSLGLGVEDRETVLRATYGYRQRRRTEESRKAEQTREEQATPTSPEPWRIHRAHRRDRG